MWLQRFGALLLLFSALAPFAQAPAARPNTTFVHKPARVFHGNALHEELWVVVNGERIGADSPCVSAPGATGIDSPASRRFLQRPASRLAPTFLRMN